LDKTVVPGVVFQVAGNQLLGLRRLRLICSFSVISGHQAKDFIRAVTNGRDVLKKDLACANASLPISLGSAWMSCLKLFGLFSSFFLTARMSSFMVKESKDFRRNYSMTQAWAVLVLGLLLLGLAFRGCPLSERSE